MQRWLKILVFLLVLFFICWFLSPIFQTIIYSAKIGSELPEDVKPPIQIFSWIFPDLFFFGTAFALTIENNLDRPFKNCRIAFDSKYLTSLQQLKRWNPQTRYNFPTASDIPPKSRLTFEFSHDVSNGWEFRDATGEHYLYRWGPPQKITIEFSNFQKMSWKLSWKLTKGQRTYLPEEK